MARRLGYFDQLGCDPTPASTLLSTLHGTAGKRFQELKQTLCRSTLCRTGNWTAYFRWDGYEKAFSVRYTVLCETHELGRKHIQNRARSTQPTLRWSNKRCCSNDTIASSSAKRLSGQPQASHSGYKLAVVITPHSQRLPRPTIPSSQQKDALHSFLIERATVISGGSQDCSITRWRQPRRPNMTSQKIPHD